jgi:3',5'-cyclic AMP phosphodiesterase CpdA
MNSAKPNTPPWASPADSPALITDSPRSFLFAHLSDPHLSSLVGIRKRDLLNKRVLGYLSWRSHRRAEHLESVLAALVRDLGCMHPEHIVVTGDLTHIGLPSEFREVNKWLQDLGSPSHVTVIPGNHDAYVQAPWRETFAHWVPYMISDNGLNGVADNTSLFPSLRIRGSVAFIGLSTALPAAPFFATGRLGQTQLRRLQAILQETGRQGLLRIILVHHPPLPGSEKWRKRLTDGSELCSILTREGVEMVLHGHSHRSELAQLNTSAGLAPVIGVPSASAIGHRPERRAQYNLYRLSNDGTGWNLCISVRGLAPSGDRFIAVAQREINLRPPRE